MTFEGNWEQVSGENREKILEALDCPKEFIQKLEGGPKLKLTIKKEGDALSWQVTVGEMSVTTLMKVGEAHSVGAHSPNYKAQPTNITDTVLEEDIVDLEGNKHGTVKTEVNGDELTAITAVKGIQSSATFKRV